MAGDVIAWLLQSDEPWTRYRTLVDLLDAPEAAAEVRAARAEMLDHPQVRSLVGEAAKWPAPPLTRHNDASHPLHKLATLADFGLRANDLNMGAMVDAVLAHQSPEGALQSSLLIPKAFGGSGGDQWAWMACDAPVLLYALLAMGCGEEARVQRALQHLVGLVQENGWRCAAAPALGRFRGPGRKADPCPIANVQALKAISLVPALRSGPAARAGVETLLSLWEERGERRPYLFGIGTAFGRLKYPLVWYDILHVTDVLSRFPLVRTDPRFLEMLAALTAQGDGQGRFTAGSMYMSWKGWSFADKKHPSPWLTFLALRTERRARWA